MEYAGRFRCAKHYQSLDMLGRDQRQKGEANRMKMTSKYRNFMYLLSIGLIFTLAYAYATTHLNLGGTGSITLPNTNLFAAINGVSASTTCSAISSTSYTDTGLSVTWPTVVQGTSS